MTRIAEMAREKGRPASQFAFVTIAIVAISLVTGALLSDAGLLGPLLGAVIGSSLCIIVLHSPRYALLGLVIWLVLLGLTRRLAAQVDLPSAAGDPLLLVAAVTWILLTATAVQNGALLHRTRLTWSYLTLLILLGLSVLNPLQGDVSVGFGGFLLVVVPMLAFLVGRSMLDERLLRTLSLLIGGLGVCCALYGLYQTSVGLPPWDQAWVERQPGYAALNVGGVIRGFSTFTAASEYGYFLGASIVVWVTYCFRAFRIQFAIAGLAVLGTALWLQSSRSIFVFTILACGSVLAARKGVPWGRSIAIGVAMVAAIPFVVGRLAPDSFGQGSSGRLAEHQVSGLADPFADDSTLYGHVDLVVHGIGESFRNPMGKGVGSVTQAASKFGGIQSNSEADLGNAGLAAGLAGLVAYLSLVAVAIPRLYRTAASKRDPSSLVVLGVVMLTLFQWLNGGQYAVAFLPWLALGWIDRLAVTRPGVPAPDRPWSTVHER